MRRVWGLGPRLALLALLSAVAERGRAMTLDQHTEQSSHARELLSGALWQAWQPSWSGHLARVDIYMGTASPCREVNAVLVVREGKEVLHSQAVRTTCDKCAASTNTCLFAPACRLEACLAWQTWRVDTPVPISHDQSYTIEVSIQGEGKEPVRVFSGVAVSSLNHGGLSSLAANPHIRTNAFSQYSFRTFMHERSPTPVSHEELALSTPPAPGNGEDADEEGSSRSAAADATASTTAGIDSGLFAGILIPVVLLVAVAAVVVVARRHRDAFTTKNAIDNNPFAGPNDDAPFGGKTAWGDSSWSFSSLGQGGGTTGRPSTINVRSEDIEACPMPSTATPPALRGAAPTVATAQTPRPVAASQQAPGAPLSKTAWSVWESPPAGRVGTPGRPETVLVAASPGQAPEPSAPTSTSTSTSASALRSSASIPLELGPRKRRTTPDAKRQTVVPRAAAWSSTSAARGAASQARAPPTQWPQPRQGGDVVTDPGSVLWDGVSIHSGDRTERSSPQLTRRLNLTDSQLSLNTIDV